ncbi:MAG: signal recognition particle-docking protein FtsY [Acidobacteria bacterium]|nr:signal recognition particle-docking protein FtsY [Acidobacteriota bacterium]
MLSSLFNKLKTAVKSTTDNLAGKIGDLFLGKKKIDAEVLDQLEAILIGADIGVPVTMEILERARKEIGRNALNDMDQLVAVIKDTLRGILERPAAEDKALAAAPPGVVFVVGVNGVGKTTTIGKLANRYILGGRKVVVCAADTFRAAAIEQLEIWAQRSGAVIVRKSHGADPSAVLYESVDRARADGADLVIVDTAGRLHTKHNLMKELEKMRNIAGKRVPGAPHEVYLIIDATTGQNGLNQAREFLRTTGVTGLVVTKLDGTAKGGVVVAISRELNLPIRYVGIGEKMDDLIEFNVDDYVESIFSRN